MSEIIKLSDLQPDPHNANKGTERGRALLEKSLHNYGAGRSILLDKNGRIIAGNKTAQTAGEIGIDDVIVVRTSGDKLVAVLREDLDLSDDESGARMLAYADNRVGQIDLDFDPEVLLADMNAGFELDDFWFDDELKDLFAGIEGYGNGAGEPQDAEPQITEAEAEKYQKIWQVKEGDIWQVGRHRIACVDCLNEAVVLSFLDGVKIDFVWSDPPYGIDIVAANGYVGGGEAYDIPFGGVKNKRLGSANAAKPFGSKGSDVRGSVGAANLIDVGKYAPVIGDNTTETAIKSSTLCLALFPDAMQVWWGGNYYASKLPDSPCWLIWDKENTGNFADCELAWTNHNGATRIFHHMWNGMVKASEHGQRRVHPTQKPVALARWAFEKYGDGGNVILDSFLGSGISIKAAEALDDDRIVYGCDLAPAYIATILQWASDNNITPQRIG